MLRHSTDEAMDVTAPVAPRSAKGGEAECAAPPPPPPMKEVNNNVYAARGDDGHAASLPPPPAPTHLHTPTSSEELEKTTEAAPEAAAATVYCCGSVRLSVSARAQWLCVARLPRDFTREELIELVEEYGAVEETHMIHSETTGKQRAGAATVRLRRGTGTCS